MDQHTLVAIALAGLASFGFSAGAAVQHLAVGREHQGRTTMGASAFGRLLRNPRWLLGLLLLAASAGMHAYALFLAPVSVVQPVGILAVAWSVVISARLHGHRVPRAVWAWVAMTVAALAFFSIISARHTTAGDRPEPGLLAVVLLLAGGLAAILALAGHLGPHRSRCLAWAAGGAVLYGLSSVQIRVLSTSLLQDRWLADPFFWFLATLMLGGLGAGGWMIQQAYANGPAETVVGAMTTIDPVVAVLIGLVALGEGSGITPAVGSAMTLLGMAAVLGVVLLARDHPDAVAPHDRTPIESPAGSA